MCARLCDRSTIIKEPWYSAVFGWVRVLIVRRSDATRGLIRRLAVEIGFGPWIAVELVMCPAAQLVSGARESRIPPFLAGCGLRPCAVADGRADWIGNLTLKPDPVHDGSAADVDASELWCSSQGQWP